MNVRNKFINSNLKHKKNQVYERLKILITRCGCCVSSCRSVRRGQNIRRTGIDYARVITRDVHILEVARPSVLDFLGGQNHFNFGHVLGSADVNLIILSHLDERIRRLESVTSFVCRRGLHVYGSRVEPNRTDRRKACKRPDVHCNTTSWILTLLLVVIKILIIIFKSNTINK